MVLKGKKITLIFPIINNTETTQVQPRFFCNFCQSLQSFVTKIAITLDQSGVRLPHLGHIKFSSKISNLNS